MKNALLIVAGALPGLLIGYFVASQSGEPASVAPTEILVSDTRSSARPAAIADDGFREAAAEDNLAVVEALSAYSYDEKFAAFDRLRNGTSITNMIGSLQAAQAMSLDELQQALEEIGKRPATGLGDFMAPFYLFSAWVEIDPEGAKDFYLDSKNPIQRHMLGAALFSSWGARDPDGAMAVIDGIQNMQERAGALNAVVSAIAQTDAPRAYALMSERAGMMNPWSYQSVFSNWATQDARGAMATIQGMPSGNFRNQALSGYFNAMVQLDPAQAASEAVQINNDAERNTAMQSVMRNWLERDFTAATDFILTIPEAQRYQVLESVTWQFGRSNPNEAMEWVLANTQGEVQDKLTGSIVERMAEHNPQEAAAFVETLPFGRAYERSVNRLANNWRETDPRATITWLETLPPDDTRNNALKETLGQLARNNVAEAQAYLTSMPAGGNRNDFAATIADSLAKQDPKQAMNWAGALDDGAMRDRAQRSAMSSWANSDPEGLYNYISNADDPAALPNMTTEIAKSWAKRNPQEAASWSLGLDESMQQEAVKQVSDEWLEHNSYEASAWIAELPEGNLRNTGVNQLIDKLYHSDPATAMDWLGDINDPKAQAQSAQKIYDQWKESDPAAAEKALRASDLPVDTINQLLKN